MKENPYVVQTGDSYNIVMQIQEKVTETHDAFIFETIRPWSESNAKLKISKKILSRALQCFQKEHFEEYTQLQEEIENEYSDSSKSLCNGQV